MLSGASGSQGVGPNKSLAVYKNISRLLLVASTVKELFNFSQQRKHFFLQAGGSQLRAPPNWMLNQSNSKAKREQYLAGLPEGAQNYEYIALTKENALFSEYIYKCTYVSSQRTLNTDRISIEVGSHIWQPCFLRRHETIFISLRGAAGSRMEEKTAW